MPLYEYRCQKCGNVDEHLMKLSDPPPEGCTKCAGPVEKLLSQTSFALKGDGWYVTDYKPKPAGAAADAPPTADAPAAAASGAQPAAPNGTAGTSGTGGPASASAPSSAGSTGGSSSAPASTSSAGSNASPAPAKVKAAP